MKKFTQEEFNTLADRIRDGDCVLFLGPDLLLNNKKENIYTAFSQLKCSEMKTKGIEFDESQADNIYYTVNRYIKGVTESERPGYSLVMTSRTDEKKGLTGYIEKNIDQNSIYSKLSKLPFYLVMNTNPDDQLYRFQKDGTNGREHHFFYYDFTIENNETVAQTKLPTEITPDNFVVYNVYGHATRERARSLVISESEFVNYAKKVNLPGNGMPACIKNFIQNEKVCLFLGFKYELWPLKILLQALGFSDAVPKQNISFHTNRLSKHEQDFYRDEMKFLFIDSAVEEFVAELVQRFDDPGMVQGLSEQPKKALECVFISNAFPKDEDQKQDLFIRDKISAQLKPMQRAGYISLWSEDMKRASENEPLLLEEKYSKADIFILLGSDSLADDHISRNMQKAIEWVKKDTAKILIPVLVRHYAIEDIKEIAKQNWIPKLNEEPVPIIDDTGNIDKKCAEVAAEIKKIVTTILSSPSNG